MFKRILGVLAIALTFTAAAQAQENATLIMRSGDRVTGQLIDHGGVGFTMRVNGEERRIPTNDVAVIDFSGAPMTDADWARLSGGGHYIWLRTGEVINGTFFDIGGTTPLNITFRTGAGDRQFASNEISRIVLGRPVSAVGTTGTPAPVAPPILTPATGGGIVVPAHQFWTATGVTVRRGELITFATSGEIQLSTDASDIAGSAGSRNNRTAPNAPLPSNLTGALIGRIDNGPAFAIGNQTSVRMPAAGVLYLGINDDHVADNRGEFRVEIRRGRR